MGFLNGLLLIIWALSGAATVALVLMHSGKGTGLSDMIASSLYSNAASAGVWEKNLDRMTIIAASVFFLTIIVFMFTYPLGTI